MLVFRSLYVFSQMGLYIVYKNFTVVHHSDRQMFLIHGAVCMCMFVFLAHMCRVIIIVINCCTNFKDYVRNIMGMLIL